MKRLWTQWYLVVAVVGFLFLPAYGLDYQSGFSFISVPDPLSGNNPTYPLIARNVPTVGESFYDARFQTVLTRVTQVDGISGRHEYSRFDPYNADQSLVALIFGGDSDWRIYRTQTFPYNQSGNLVMTLRSIKEPRWDPADPQLLWYLQDFRIVTASVHNGQGTTVKDFSLDPTIGPIVSAEADLYRITTMDEGESSLDRRYWALCLQGAHEDYRVRYLFTWDREIDQVLGVYQIPLQEARIDWVGMSPKGNWVLIGGDWDNGGTLVGLTMANKELSQFHRLDYATAHSDVGLDSEGNEVIVMQNVLTDFIDLIPIALTTQPILAQGGSYANTNRTPLVRLFYDAQSQVNLNSGVHISSNVPGYCVVSTYIQQGLTEQNWLDRTISLVRLDRNNPRVFYLAKVYSTTGTYWEETHAAITNDGSKVVWTSNWDQNVGAEQVFLMQLDMPSNWRQLTGGEQPLYFSHSASNSLWETEIAIVNASATETVTGTLRPFGDSGAAVSATLPVTLAPHSRRQITISQEFTNPDTIGYLVFDSDSSSVKGYTKFYRQGLYRAAIPATAAVNTGDVYLTHVTSDPSWWTGVSVLNTTSQAKTVSFEFNDGTTITRSLGAREHQKFLVSDLFNGQTPAGISSAVLTNGSGVIGLELFSSANQVEGIPLSDDTASILYYPYVPSDSNWWAGIVVYNPSATACTLTITPYLTGGSQGTALTRTLNGKEKYRDLVSNLGLPQQTAWFTIESTTGITGFELIGTADSNQVGGFYGMGAKKKEGVFAKLEKGGGWTSLTLANTEGTQATVTLSAYDDSGTQVAATTFTLNAHANVAQSAEEFFPNQTIATATYLSYNSDKDLVALQLNGSADNTMLDGLAGL